MFSTDEAARLRAWRWHRQGLDGSLQKQPPAAILASTGWARSVGGCCPYLTLFSRAGHRRATIDKAITELQIHELPSARGCTYVLPASHFGLGLALSYVSSESECKVARKLGVTDAELATLAHAVKAALQNGAMSPDELRAAVGAASRSLGPEGAKKGLSTTLPLALGMLQSSGDIRRISMNGRFDHQRFKYTRWNAPAIPDLAAAHAELAKLYFDWTGPATPAEFQWFSGLGVKVAKEAMAGLDLIDTGEGRLLPAGQLQDFRNYTTPAKPHFNLVAGIDAIALLRRDAPGLLAPEYSSLGFFTGKRMATSGTLSDLPSNAILDRGSLVGLWEYDPAAGEVVYWSFGGRSDPLAEAVKQMEAYIREDLGDARSFSLDSPQSRAPYLQFLREAAK